MLNKRGVITSAVIFEILILVVAIVAFSYLVSAEETSAPAPTATPGPTASRNVVTTTQLLEQQGFK